MRQFLKVLLCGHTWSPNLAKHIFKDGKAIRKKHFHYCLKCGKRKYID